MSQFKNRETKHDYYREYQGLLNLYIDIIEKLNIMKISNNVDRLKMIIIENIKLY